MSPSNKPDSTSVIREAIRAKREQRPSGRDIAELEASLLADIETFDLDAVERRVRHEQFANTGTAGMLDPTLRFPEVIPGSPPPNSASQATQVAPPSPTPASSFDGRSSLLGQLRRQAEQRQHEQHRSLAEHTSINEEIDRILKETFNYLHEFVQQLNIVKPAIPRDYPLVDELVLESFTWQEGFADYRAQAQSIGALVELVSFSCQFGGNGALRVERKAPAIERFRTMLFDYGLQFSCQEFRNPRRYVERAEFEIRSELSISARWRADFDNGTIILETRNLERLGSARYLLQPQTIDENLLDEFGRLLLGQPNRFRELATRRKA